MFCDTIVVDSYAKKCASYQVISCPALSAGAYRIFHFALYIQSKKPYIFEYFSVFQELWYTSKSHDGSVRSYFKSFDSWMQPPSVFFRSFKFRSLQQNTFFILRKVVLTFNNPLSNFSWVVTFLIKWPSQIKHVIYFIKYNVVYEDLIYCRVFFAPCDIFSFYCIQL